jgi:hypothetical protein
MPRTLATLQLESELRSNVTSATVGLSHEINAQI